MKHPTQGFQAPAPWTRADARPAPRAEQRTNLLGGPLRAWLDDPHADPQRTCCGFVVHAPTCPTRAPAAAESQAPPPTPEPPVPPAGEEMPASGTKMALEHSLMPRILRPKANGCRGLHVGNCYSGCGARLAEQDAPKAVPTAAKPGETLGVYANAAG